MKTAKQKLADAEATEERKATALQFAAHDYAVTAKPGGWDALTAAAKQWTNANHATGRARKAAGQ